MTQTLSREKLLKHIQVAEGMENLGGVDCLDDIHRIAYRRSVTRESRGLQGWLCQSWTHKKWRASLDTTT